MEAGTRFVTAAGYKNNQWDTHGDNDKLHRDELVPTFDETFSALLDDLEQRGLLESTVVIAMGEFGRTPTINPKLGRDHWPQCWSIALAGGGIQGGQVVGASDEQGGYVADRMVTIGGRVCHCLQSLWNRLGKDLHDTRRPADQNRQLDRRRNRRSHQRVDITTRIFGETASDLPAFRFSPVAKMAEELCIHL